MARASRPDRRRASRYDLRPPAVRPRIWQFTGAISHEGESGALHRRAFIVPGAQLRRLRPHLADHDVITAMDPAGAQQRVKALARP